nr:MAG TPA: hypothetical protein [Caudoviricetes sp.]
MDSYYLYPLFIILKGYFYAGFTYYIIYKYIKINK